VARRPAPGPTLATLHRVWAHLETAAARLVGPEAPTLRAIRVDIVGALIFAATISAVLLAMSGPVRPAAVTGTMMAGIVAAALSDTSIRAIIRRRLLSPRPPLVPLLPTAGTVDEAVTTALREIHASIVALLPEGDPPAAEEWVYAWDEMHAARDWLAYALAAREATI
jgi:hypothetical protein